MTCGADATRRARDFPASALQAPLLRRAAFVFGNPLELEWKAKSGFANHVLRLRNLDLGFANDGIAFRNLEFAFANTKFAFAKPKSAFRNPSE